MIYTCKHFDIKELVPPETYQQANGNDWKLWMLFDPLALKTLDALRDQFGHCTVNDWSWGGQFKYSGYRPPSCQVGSQWSQHRFGRAFDCKFRDVTAAEARMVLKDTKRDDLYQALIGVRRIENDVNWLHFDLGNWVAEDIRFFKP